MRELLSGLLADPCRIVRELFDWRSLWRMLRQVRRHGVALIKSELSAGLDADAAASIPHPATARPRTPSGNQQRKAILVIDRSIPLFDRDAGSRSCYQYLLLFADLGLRVIFLPHDQIIRQPYANALQAAGIEILAGKGIRCGGWKRWLKSHASSIDLIFLHRPNIARHYLDFARKTTKARIFYCGVDLRYWREKRRYAVEGDRFHRSEAVYWESIETRLCSQADASYFFSEPETEEIQKRCPSANVRTIPIFLETGDPDNGQRPPFDQRAGLLFVGNFAHSPNSDAVLWFAREIFPRILDAIPDIKLHVVGANSSDSISRLASENLIIHGAVSDNELQSFYNEARIVVAPLRYGAGVKGKVIEAMRRAVPVVTTTVGAEGIPSEALTVADTATTFANAVVDLYRNTSLWEHRRRDSEHAARRQFSRELACSILNKDFETPVFQPRTRMPE